MYIARKNSVKFYERYDMIFYLLVTIVMNKKMIP